MNETSKHGRMFRTNVVVGQGRRQRNVDGRELGDQLSIIITRLHQS